MQTNGGVRETCLGTINNILRIAWSVGTELRIRFQYCYQDWLLHIKFYETERSIVQMNFDEHANA